MGTHMLGDITHRCNGWVHTLFLVCLLVAYESAAYEIVPGAGVVLSTRAFSLPANPDSASSSGASTEVSISSNVPVVILPSLKLQLEPNRVLTFLDMRAGGLDKGEGDVQIVVKTDAPSTDGIEVELSVVDAKISIAVSVPDASTLASRVLGWASDISAFLPSVTGLVTQEAPCPGFPGCAPGDCGTAEARRMGTSMVLASTLACLLTHLLVLRGEGGRDNLGMVQVRNIAICLVFLVALSSGFLPASADAAADTAQISVTAYVVLPSCIRVALPEWESGTPEWYLAGDDRSYDPTSGGLQPNEDDNTTGTWANLVLLNGRTDSQGMPTPPKLHMECFGSLAQYGCPVPGRPYMDDDGLPLLSAPLSTHDSAPAWSAAQFEEEGGGSEGGRRTLGSSMVREEREALGKKWAQAGAGEHASVASFAAVTLALLTNGAPPALVEESLLAALDEVRHARTAFSIAGALLGEVVEPGALKPASLTLEQNLTKLATSTAREGCLDETLSALKAAEEAEAASEEELVRSLRRVASEEGRHAALAWRTVQWACGVNAAVCEAVRHELSDAALSRASRRHSASPSVSAWWKNLTATLVPHVTSSSSSSSFSSSASASSSASHATLPARSLSESAGSDTASRLPRHKKEDGSVGHGGGTERALEGLVRAIMAGVIDASGPGPATDSDTLREAKAKDGRVGEPIENCARG